MQELVWHGKNEDGYTWGIVWENDTEFNPITEDIEKGIQTTVSYKCSNPACGGLMKNYDKAIIIPRGEWRATAAAKSPYTKSFHITPIYNPPGMYSWDDMVKQWSECWDIKNNRLRDKEKYRIFRNTKQGHTFEDMGKQIERERVIQFRRSGFIAGMVPNDTSVQDSGSPILIVVASVDVQSDRLYVDVKGYSYGGVTWTLDFFAIEGTTATFNGPWDQLSAIIGDKRYIGTDGKTYRIQITLIDSGHNAEYVYNFVKSHSAGVFACKGRDTLPAQETYQFFSAKAQDNIGFKNALHINTGKLKDRISNALTLSFWISGQSQPWWYPNFPEDFKDDYFEQFEAEQKVELRNSITGQFIKYIWKQQFGKDNHAFDTYVYNLAGLELVAEGFCRERLGLPALDWTAFWDFANTGWFYDLPPASA
jgi:phage terminase large subunit GpA-like protein